MFLKEHSWGDTHNILSDKKILAKEHLALLERTELMQKVIDVVWFGATTTYVGDPQRALDELQNMFRKAMRLLNSEAKT